MWPAIFHLRRVSDSSVTNTHGSLDQGGAFDRRDSRESRMVAILLVPSALLLCIQGLGAAGTVFNLPLFLTAFGGRFYWWWVSAGVVLSAIAPLTSATALIRCLREKSSESSKVRNRRIVICAIFVTTSWVGCAWTFFT